RHEVRYREIRRKDVLWLVASSSQGCIDTIWITQDAESLDIQGDIVQVEQVQQNGSKVADV
ncbi:hypothetical protein PIB30_103665, partial [Stylosanthes scabra]|nr:hypothetical protein [Stylosanthes scabra]